MAQKDKQRRLLDSDHMLTMVTSEKGDNPVRQANHHLTSDPSKFAKRFTEFDDHKPNPLKSSMAQSQTRQTEAPK